MTLFIIMMVIYPWRLFSPAFFPHNSKRPFSAFFFLSPFSSRGCQDGVLTFRVERMVIIVPEVSSSLHLSTHFPPDCFGVCYHLFSPARGGRVVSLWVLLVEDVFINESSWPTCVLGSGGEPLFACLGPSVGEPWLLIVSKVKALLNWTNCLFTILVRGVCPN